MITASHSLSGSTVMTVFNIALVILIEKELYVFEELDSTQTRDSGGGENDKVIGSCQAMTLIFAMLLGSESEAVVRVRMTLSPQKR